MNKQKTVTLMECRYCDSTMSHSFMDVRACVSCGAEWDPVAVQHPYEEVYGREEEHDEFGLVYEEACRTCSKQGGDREDQWHIDLHGVCTTCTP